MLHIFSNAIPLGSASAREAGQIKSRVTSKFSYTQAKVLVMFQSFAREALKVASVGRRVLN
jgi:hypothetical protein